MLLPFKSSKYANHTIVCKLDCNLFTKTSSKTIVKEKDVQHILVFFDKSLHRMCLILKFQGKYCHNLGQPKTKSPSVVL